MNFRKATKKNGVWSLHRLYQALGLRWLKSRRRWAPFTSVTELASMKSGPGNGSFILKHIPHGRIYLVLATGFIWAYAALVWRVSDETLHQPFRGFLVSESLRVGEFRLPAWDIDRTSVLPGDRLSAINGQSVTRFENVEAIEKTIPVGQAVQYGFTNALGQQKVAPFLRTHFNENDRLLTMGVITFDIVFIHFALLVCLIFADRRWGFPGWLFATCGTVWFLGTFDYYTTQVFSTLTILFGVALAPAALMFNVRVCGIREDLRMKIFLALAFSVSLGLGVFHIQQLRSVGRFEFLSYTLLWTNAFAWSVVGLFLTLRKGLERRLSHHMRIRIAVIVTTQFISYVATGGYFVCGYIFSMKVPLNYFVPLLQVFPLSLSILFFAEMMYLRSKQLESRIIARERFVSLGILSAGLAHEINNPLNVLSMSVQALKHHMETPQRQTKKNRESMQILSNHVVQSVQRIANVVDSINAFTRGNLQVNPKVDLNAAVDEVLNDLAEVIADKKVEVIKQLRDVHFVSVGPGALQQVLRNLIKNAVDAVAIQGEIQIEATYDHEVLRILVKDNGPGISPKILPHVFEPFFTTKDTGKGMGLGLWVCAQLMAAHGGKIEAMCPSEGGCVFALSLPQNNFPVAIAPPTPSEQDAPLPEKFLYKRWFQWG